jgi:hypothetical protein
MPESSSRFFRGVLDPIERISEILFGLIMALTFTGTLSAATAGRTEVGEMLLGAIGCNLAWGLVDGFMYLIASLVERGRNLRTYREVCGAADMESGRQALAGALPPAVASILSREELASMHQRLKQLPNSPESPRFRKDDFLGALACCLLVFLSTFPLVLPFFFIQDVGRALRASNGIAILMLFLGGFMLGRYAGYRPWRMGLGMVFLGIALVAITIALGG